MASTAAKMILSFLSNVSAAAFHSGAKVWNIKLKKKKIYIKHEEIKTME